MLVFLWSACLEKPEELLARGLAAQDPAAAAEDLHRACEGGLVPACDAAGALPIDDPREPSWNERACEGGIAAACLRRSQAPDDTFARRACELEDADACGALAHATQDAALLQKACLAGHRASCLPAADAARGAGDRQKAAELYDVRCAHDPDDTSCLLAQRMREQAPPGDLAWPEGDLAAVSELLWEGCARNEAWDCLRLAEHVDGGGPLPEKARGDAAWLRDQACDLQLAYACAPHMW
jgi:hypothetical protein